MNIIEIRNNIKQNLFLYTTAIIVLVIGILFIKFFFFTKPTLITITGKGTVTEKPTQVKMIITVTNVSLNITEGFAENTRLTNKIINSAVHLGANQSEIVASFARASSTDMGNGKKAYAVANTLAIIFHNLTNINNTLGQLYNNGAYSITDITFTTENPQRFEENAIAKAIEDAKQRADSTAKLMNKHVGKMVSISGSESGQADAMVGKIESLDIDALSSLPSQIEISRQATIVFELW